jgi:prepilin-type N-terminal cleavage/methylation domain-containing protein
MRKSKGFTLIELLIVVAIIAILAAIAVPNFLEAQVRSKVSRVKADLRSISTGLETYMIDYNNYPPDHPAPQFRLEDVYELTTPISYITSVDLADPFIPSKVVAMNSLRGYQYFNLHDGWGALVWPGVMGDDEGPMSGCLKSWGPNAGKNDNGYYGDDGGEWLIFGADYPGGGSYPYQIDRVYDGTNGTVSWGDILRFAGDSRGLPQQP